MKPMGMMSTHWARNQVKPVRVFDSSKLAPKPTAQRRPVQRRNLPARKAQTIHLPPDIERELATYCASHGREPSEVIANALVLFLERRR
jgi:hypothetical protein